MGRVKLLTSILLLMFFFVPVDYRNDEDLSTVFSNIINYYNTADRNIYDYIDSSNSRLYQKIKGNIGRCNINYDKQINIKTLGNNEYLVGVQMTGSGKVYNSKWAFLDMFMTFRFKYIEEDNIYIMIDTDFFDKSGIDLLRKAYSDLLVNVLVISFFIFVVILFISYKIYKKAMEDEMQVIDVKK